MSLQISALEKTQESLVRVVILVHKQLVVFMRHDMYKWDIFRMMQTGFTSEQVSLSNKQQD